MMVCVVIPVGPGHQELAGAAKVSVLRAWACSRGPFTDLQVVPVADHDGRLGRSRARNVGLDVPADWHFLLDADDEMMPNAFGFVDLAASATFGAVCLNGQPYIRDRQPVTRETIFEHGAHGTLSMGCFVRGDLGLRFNEGLDVGEDFDFYLRLPDFTKRTAALVSIGYDHPSAGGPRGYHEIDWREICRRVIDGYR